jgi:hypothetical protein
MGWTQFCFHGNPSMFSLMEYKIEKRNAFGLFHYFCLILTKNELLTEISVKLPNTNSHENPSCENKILSYMQAEIKLIYSY